MIILDYSAIGADVVYDDDAGVAGYIKKRWREMTLFSRGAGRTERGDKLRREALLPQIDNSLPVA